MRVVGICVSYQLPASSFQLPVASCKLQAGSSEGGAGIDRMMAVFLCSGGRDCRRERAMTNTLSRPVGLATAAVLALAVVGSPKAAGRFPDPVRDTPKSAAQDWQTAGFAGGCFWGVEAVFEALEGV